MIAKRLFVLCFGCGLVLALSGCGKSKNNAPVAVTPPATTNSPAVSTFESSLAKAQSLYDQGNFVEARDAARACKPSGYFEHRKVANLKAEIAKAMHASKPKDGDGQKP